MNSKKLFCLFLTLTFIAAGFMKKTSEAAEAPPGQAEAEPNPKIDCVAKINELAKAGRDESLNAAPFYQKAIELCVEQPKEVIAINNSAWPADLSAKEQSVLKQWVQSNCEALWQLELGAKKPYYWAERSSEDGSAMGTLMPGLSEFRQLAFALRWRMKLHAAEGNIDKAVADIITCYRFGLHQTGPKVLVEQLVGIALRSIAIQTAFAILDRTKPDGDLLPTLQSQIEQLSASEGYMLDMRGEKFVILDLIQRIFTDDGNGDGRIRMESELAKMMLDVMDINTEEQIQSFQKLKRRQTTEVVEKVFEYYNSAFRKIPWQWKDDNINHENEIERITSGNVLVKHFIPSAFRLAELFNQGSADTDALITTIALFRYEVDKGQFPERLDELIPAGYLKVLSTDPFSNRAFVYKRVNDNFTLYSFGRDCDDDGGQVDRDIRGKFKKWADAGDAVFWSVEPAQK
ncbi:MAG: hypothetical protein ACYSWO_25815 [Planctomycetota bacterium]|jgi:hypothetical protein